MLLLFSCHSTLQPGFPSRSLNKPCCQVDVLNEDYKPQNISFDLIDIDYTVNDDWATDAWENELDMKSNLHQGTYADLNIYFISDLVDFEKEEMQTIGQCHFPKNTSDDQSVLALDGCIAWTETLPGGPGEIGPTRNSGKTATHEVGHWFGLLHVFQGLSCFGDGDFVSDTNQQSEVSFGCPVGHDSCPGDEGLDNVNNYMDYADDAWCVEPPRLPLFQPQAGRLEGRMQLICEL